MDLKEAALLGDSAADHWYYRSKAAAILHYLRGRNPRRILDVGAGSGFFTKYLLEHSSAESAVCVDTGYAADREERFCDKPLAYRRTIEKDPADLVLFMDVLEHVEDDTGLLVSYAERVAPGATFLITVPAFQWMWSEHDVFLEHRRRYTIRQLENAIARAGLDVVRSSYYFGFVFPIAAALRIGGRMFKRQDAEPKSQLSRQGWAANAVLNGLCKAELPLVPWNRLAGLSVLCLAARAA